MSVLSQRLVQFGALGCAVRNGEELLFGCDDGCVRKLVGIAKMDASKIINYDLPSQRSDDKLNSISLSCNKDCFAVSCDDGMICVSDATTDNISLKTVTQFEAASQCCEFHPLRNNILAAGCDDGKISIVDKSQHTEIFRTIVCDSGVRNLRWNCSEEKQTNELICATADGTVVIYNITLPIDMSPSALSVQIEPKCIAKQISAKQSSALSVNSAGTLIAIASKANKNGIEILSAQSLAVLHTIGCAEQRSGDVECICFCGGSNADMVAIGTNRGVVLVYKISKDGKKSDLITQTQMDNARIATMAPQSDNALIVITASRKVYFVSLSDKATVNVKSEQPITSAPASADKENTIRGMWSDDDDDDGSPRKLVKRQHKSLASDEMKSEEDDNASNVDTGDNDVDINMDDIDLGDPIAEAVADVDADIGVDMDNIADEMAMSAMDSGAPMLRGAVHPEIGGMGAVDPNVEATDKYLCWNEIGAVIVSSSAQSQWHYEVDFRDKSVFSRAVRFTDSRYFNVASLSDEALLLCANDETNGNGVIQLRSFHSWTNDCNWCHLLPLGEFAISCALTPKYAAVLTSKRYLRVFSVGGLQMSVISLSGAPIAMCGSLTHDSIGVVYQNESATLRFWLLDLRKKKRVVDLDLALSDDISNGAQLRWMCLYKSTVAYLDNANVLRILDRSAMGGAWIPMLDHIDGNDDESQLWPLYFHDNALMCIVSSDVPMPAVIQQSGLTPIPIALQMPLCDINVMRNESTGDELLSFGLREEQTLRQRICSTALVDESHSDTQMIQKKWLKAQLQLFQIAAGEMNRPALAMDIARIGMGHNQSALAKCVKIASFLKRSDLAQRITDECLTAHNDFDASSVETRITAPVIRQTKVSGRKRTFSSAMGNNQTADVVVESEPNASKRRVNPFSAQAPQQNTTNQPKKSGFMFR